MPGDGQMIAYGPRRKATSREEMSGARKRCVSAVTVCLQGHGREKWPPTTASRSSVASVWLHYCAATGDLISERSILARVTSSPRGIDRVIPGVRACFGRLAWSLIRMEGNKMWQRSLGRGFMLGLGFMLARLLWGPIVMLVVAAGGWAWVWSSTNHVGYMVGVNHTLQMGRYWVAWLMGHAHRIRVPGALHHAIPSAADKALN